MAVHRFLASTPGNLVMVQLEDAFGEEEQANLPGTDEHPNWRRKLGRRVRRGRHPSLGSGYRRGDGGRGSQPEVTDGAADRATRNLPPPVPQELRVRPRAPDRPLSRGLGISHLYASPLTMARPGSTHGYDVIDFNRLNPELGDEAAFEALIAELHRHDMGLVLDFVPNHMGVGSDNPWWLDVLEWGPLSPYAAFFDIDWEASARGIRGKLTLPVLGDQYGKVLEAGELRLLFDGAAGTFAIGYHDQLFPIAVRRYPQLLHATGSLLDREGAALFELADRFAALGTEDAPPEQWAVRRQEAFALKAALAETAAAARRA